MRQIGLWSKHYLQIKDVFMDNKRLLDYADVHSNLFKCDVFSSDPQEKKLQLLIQKYRLLMVLRHYQVIIIQQLTIISLEVIYEEE